jgi:hypothetical protein
MAGMSKSAIPPAEAQLSSYAPLNGAPQAPGLALSLGLSALFEDDREMLQHSAR